MKVIHITADRNSALFSELIDLPNFTLEAACEYLGQQVDESSMDQVDMSQWIFGAFSVSFAQVEPWTWVRHIFAKAS